MRRTPVAATSRATARTSCLIAALVTAVLIASNLLDAQRVVSWPLPGSPFTVTHATLVDGTGTPATIDQSIVVENGRISAVGPTAAIQSIGQIVDLRGRTVIPGLVGMHEHLFYAVDHGHGYLAFPEAFARLYLAAGVTSIRTAGTIDPGQDIELKREIDGGRQIGPTLHLTGPYLDTVADVQTVVQLVNSWADAGVTSVKAYTHLRRDQLAAAIDTAHRRGLTVTGHLCAVDFREAAALGIDNLEHGLLADTEFYSRKVPDECPDGSQVLGELADSPPDRRAIGETIRVLVEKRVAVTSTLAVFESLTARPDPNADAVRRLLTWSTRRDYDAERAARQTGPEQFGRWEQLLRLEMRFERAFVAAGGLLMSGADPTGWGGTLAGTADQRNVELLVEAGFSVEAAIEIATANGARGLGVIDSLGTITAGKIADLVVLRGELPRDVHAITMVEMVIKNGTAIDPAPICAAQAGRIGKSSAWIWEGALVGPAVVMLIAGLKWVRRRRRSGATV